MIKKFWIIILILFAMRVYAVDVPLEFDDADQQQRYQTLTEELRCLVCQNQSLADSHADLAQDLRVQVYNMIKDGQSSDEITSFMVQRYGDFVLYRPPLKDKTLLLWFGPFILLLVGLYMVVRIARKSRVDDVSISEKQRIELSRLMDDKRS